MTRKYFKKIIIISSFMILLVNLRIVYNFEESFFNNNFNLFKYFNSYHIKIDDLKINENYLFKKPDNINIELALSALKGIKYDNDNKNIIEGKKNIEISKWNKLTKKDFFNENKEEENLIKGMPEPYYIYNITDNIKNTKFYFNNNNIENMEIIYKGKYIPKIYNNIFLIFAISFMYLFCIKILLQGYINGKNTAKKFISKISTLFTFFIILKIMLSLIPPFLCASLCIIVTFYFFSISMNPCENFFFLKNSKIKKEPIGWILIVFSQSILIGNFIYHLLFNVKVLNMLISHVHYYFLLHFICFVVLLLIASLIFFFMISNIFSAKKAQNFVFSFTSSYLIVSCYTYFYNLFILRFLNNTNIVQIEPIMFFSYTPKFVFNKQNMVALLILFMMTIMSLVLPKWLKQSNPLSKKIKQTDKKITNKYDVFLNYFS
ncbi:conserved Plasmodium protein, unknown function [Plasmodium gallinaceum]|uniref:Uncharacterized protein n=1 Tax=Plasmodium gallinaceum TaxID=5849 RepID=A0A1J1GW29_PLAGA|nr:conserved Plasmodium protein, unknown function [Plasmodium gallinaceum]CRG96670.1 conserved Plasmodium protein, unknown function [Plasmodium gallinaceum]